jgi:hypothetical protein
LRRRPRSIALVAGVSIPDDDVVAYRAFWLCEDGQWYATIEKGRQGILASWSLRYRGSGEVSE